MTIENLTWIKAGNKITVILPSGQPKTVTEGDGNYEPVLEAIKSRNWDAIPDLLDPKVAIFNFSDGLFEVVDGVVHVEGKPVPNGLSKKIIGFAKENLPYAPLLKFWNKLQNNPSYRNIQGLFEFLDINEYPITKDGNIIAYKGVRDDWTDRYTGKISNKIGEYVSMPRNEVNDNPALECQSGFHCATYSYATSYMSGPNGGHMIMIEVDPGDVVSMPDAYSFTKMRICAYKVLQEVFKEEKGNLYKDPVEVDNSGDVCYGNGECDSCECENDDRDSLDSGDYGCDCEDYDCQSYDSHHQDCKCNVDDRDCDYSL